MDTQRVILFVIFSMSAIFLWDAWQKEIAPPPAVVQQGAPAVPGQPAEPAKDLPTPSVTAAVPGAPPVAAPGAAAVPAPGAAVPAGQRVTIKTDLYTAEIDTVGGVISLVALDQHRDATDLTKPYNALQRTGERTFVAQAGLIGEGLPNHRTQYEVLPGPRELAPGSDTLDLRLVATAPNGDKVQQTLTFRRGSYVIDAKFDVTNAGAAPLSTHQDRIPDQNNDGPALGACGPLSGAFTRCTCAN